MLLLRAPRGITGRNCLRWSGLPIAHTIGLNALLSRIRGILRGIRSWPRLRRLRLRLRLRSLSITRPCSVALYLIALHGLWSRPRCLAGLVTVYVIDFLDLDVSASRLAEAPALLIVTICPLAPRRIAPSFCQSTLKCLQHGTKPLTDHVQFQPPLQSYSRCYSDWK